MKKYFLYALLTIGLIGCDNSINQFKNKNIRLDPVDYYSIHTVIYQSWESKPITLLDTTITFNALEQWTDIVFKTKKSVNGWEPTFSIKRDIAWGTSYQGRYEAYWRVDTLTPLWIREEELTNKPSPLKFNEESIPLIQQTEYNLEVGVLEINDLRR